MIMLRKTACTSFLLLILFAAYAQQIVVNTLGKDPFTGKASEVVYKTKDGEWSFQSFTNAVIKTTFRPAGYAKGEQVSDAVIVKPPVLNTKVVAAQSQTIEWDNAAGVVIQRDKLYYKSGKEIRVKNAVYFAQGDEHGFRFQLSDNERFFGGGERALPMNRRGYRFNLYNNPWYGYGLGADNLNFSVPVIISSNGYAIFFDNPSKGYLDIGLTDKNTLEAAFSSGELTYYIIFGKNVDEILNNYTALTGRQPLPPRWVLGNFVSRFGYRSEAQVKQVVDKMRQERFPMDGLIIDLFWFGDDVKGTMGNWDWVNTQKWPNPKQMITDLSVKEHVKTVLISEPFVLEGTKTYTEAAPFLATNAGGQPFMLTDFYFGKGGLVDVFRKQSQDWIWKQYKKQIANGVAGWWVDLAEPEKHPAGMMHNLKDAGVTRAMGADEVHNVFGHYWSKMLYEKYASDVSGTRLFNLNRAGFAGSQRYSIFPWTGDVARTWSGLKAQPLILLGMSLSGLPYVHSDAGGFSSVEQSDAELYTRWLQFAAFTPVFRPHGTALEDYDKTLKSIPSEPCYWDDPYKSIVRNYINLRYRLLPYNYSLGYEQAVYGKPLMRPLYYYSFADSNAYRAEEQYYWGDNILVAPVTSQGINSLNLYLPAGKWYGLTTNAVTNGGQWISQPVDIKDIPVFVKEGSFIPMWTPKEAAKSTDEYDSKDLTVRYYPAATASTYVWFDDDGISTKTLEKADYELVTFKGMTNGQQSFIDISTNHEANYGKKFKRKFRVELPGNAADALLNGKPVPAENISKTGNLVAVSVEFSGKPLQLVVTTK